MVDKSKRILKMTNASQPAVWFPTIKANTGVDSFTIRLVNELHRLGFQAEITWLPHHTEFLPWLLPHIKPPEWANIIHINSWLHPRFYQPFHLPVVTTCHGCVHDQALTPYKSFTQRMYHYFWISRMEHQAFNFSSKVTTVSEYTASLTRNFFGNMDIQTIPNWLADDAFSIHPKKIPIKPFRLLYLGRLSKRKGADLLPNIMEDLGDEFELRYTEHTEDKKILNTSQKNMKSLGWTSNSAQVKAWLDDADALIFPSRMEGMPLAVLEAMARGLPIICSNSSSLPEIVQHGVNGLICPVDDVKAFVQAARYLQQNSDHWYQMSSNAISYVKNNHHISESMRQYVELYKKLII